MAYFSWSDEMSVGNRFIDADHRNLIDIINHLHDAMQARNGKDVLDKVLFDLFVYTKGHFQREEDHMKAIGFTGFDAHKREHDLLLAQLNVLREKFRENPANLSVTTSQFLHSWLMDHIIGSDMELGAWTGKAA